MRCRKCDYLLWNLPARRCPECGEPFLPSQYEFQPHSVQFRCPHCDQAYYGTDARGHLSPQAFNCVSCGRGVQMDEMLLLPTDGLDEDATDRDTLPWLKREKIGPVKAWLQTIGRVTGSPTRVMRSVPVRSSSGHAWWFATVNSFLFGMMGFLPIVAVQLFVLGTAMTAMRGGGGGTPMLGMGVGFGFFLVAMIGVPLLLIVIWGGLAHGLLRLTGRTAAGPGRTYQAICYGTAVNAPMAVPCVGFYFTPLTGIWWIVNASIMLVEAQRVRSGRAIFAVATPPLGIILSVALIITFLIVPNVRTRATAFPSANEVKLVADALQSYAEDHEDAWPEHAIQLVEGNYLDTIDFATVQSDTTEEDIPIGDITLAQYDDLADREQKAVAKACVVALPENVVAYRLGDYVFVYPGIKFNGPYAGLWTVIEWPDPDQNPTLPNNQFVPVAMNNGQTIPLSKPMFPQMLAAQNKLRAAYGLPPLPHPKDVTHAKPAFHVDEEESP